MLDTLHRRHARNIDIVRLVRDGSLRGIELAGDEHEFVWAAEENLKGLLKLEAGFEYFAAAEDV